MAVGLKRHFYKNKTAVGTGPEILGRLAFFVTLVTVRLSLADFFTLSRVNCFMIFFQFERIVPSKSCY